MAPPLEPALLTVGPPGLAAGAPGPALPPAAPPPPPSPALLLSGGKPSGAVGVAGALGSRPCNGLSAASMSANVTTNTKPAPLPDTISAWPEAVDDAPVVEETTAR